MNFSQAHRHPQNYTSEGTNRNIAKSSFVNISSIPSIQTNEMFIRRSISQRRQFSSLEAHVHIPPTVI
jgi:hypothetical protein